MLNIKFQERLSVEQIITRMSLRPPQYKSLQILDDIMQTVDLSHSDVRTQEKEINAKYPIFKEFERAFPSLTFALATGVGKTRLMGAFMIYLNQNLGIRNFFIVAPNLTIYEKLKKDFGEPNHSKYVFKGINFTQAPMIVTGENYEKHSGLLRNESGININIFNIGKINAEVRGGAEPRFKRLNEYIGESYFNYLKGKSDLVMLMDESHHYRADAGFRVLNELDPYIGLELTATPQVESSKGAIKFRNVVYEYSLAQAIGNFVKTPWVATKKGFNPKSADEFYIDKIKLHDGIILHRNAAAELQQYADNTGERLVKPFVLVVCRDTAHAQEIKDYIQSGDFFDGYYADKVIEVHSAQKGAEKEENIRKLVDLERDDNTIEIVIHVNMLKEGWDVTNLYTIIPLRVAASLTLREQTIGRGLRLPYGKITGNAAVDRLTIVAHDKFDDIIRAASDENSIIRREHIIEIEDTDTRQIEVVKSKTMFDSQIEAKEKQLKFARSDEKKAQLDTEIRAMQYVGQAIENITTRVVNIRISTDQTATEAAKTINILPTKKDIKENEQLQTLVMQEAHALARRDIEVGGQMRFDTDDKLQEIDKKMQAALAPTIEEKIRFSIDIPNIALVAVGDGKRIIEDFDLDTRLIHGGFNAPSEELLLESLKDGSAHTIVTDGGAIKLDMPPDRYIVGEVLSINDRIPYETYKHLLFKLARQMIEFVRRGKTEQELIKALVVNKKQIAGEISKQITENSRVEPPKHEVKLLQGATAIRSESLGKYSDEEIRKYTDKVPAYAVRKTIFGHFEKSCTNIAKFDSVPEHDFAVILERTPEIEKWLRPALGQLPLTYLGGTQYQPDFIVETANAIFIVEIKAQNELNDETTLLKAKAAQTYCDHVNAAFEGQPNKKPWHFALIPAHDVQRSSVFAELIKRGSREWR